MRPHFIVVADASRARIFAQDRHAATPQLVDELDNPDGRRPTRDLVSDRPGWRGNHPTNWAQTKSQRTDPQEVEEVRFSRELSQYMEDVIDEGRCSTMSLILAPSLMGHVRKLLSKRVEERVVHEESMDLKNLPTRELEERLREMVPPRPVR